MYWSTSSVSIQLDSDFITLDGFTADAPSTTLSGRVVLDLAEATPISSINLTFRGVAVIPMHDPSSADLEHDVCSYDWKLLDAGSKGHRYLCPGQHTFPFKTCLGGSLPATTVASTSRTPSVSYDLHALVTCAGVHRSLGAHASVPIVRSLPSYSLEFQQSLDVETPQSSDVHVSLSIPHKAWTAGETLVCLLHASPLRKPAVVRSVDLSVVETRRLHSYNGWEENTHPISHRYHAFHSKQKGKADAAHRLLEACRGHARTHWHTSAPDSDTHVILDIPLPSVTEPSHCVAPVFVSHHLQCVVGITGADGRHSDLHCSLPLHILDARVRAHVTAATQRTRSAFFGFGELCSTEEDLPTYAAHIRDRVFAPVSSQGESSEVPLYEDIAHLPVYALPPLDSLHSLPSYSATA